MRQPDVVLIHPPSVFDFRERAVFYGPISDVIPSSPIFEMYPIGLLTLAAHLRRHGYRVRIVNLALLMMRSRRFDVQRFLKRLRPRLFGIDLHWLPHAQGGPALAALLKRIHPEIPIVFGGISATYFHRELIADPAVDFVLRGAVTEPSLLALVRQIEGAMRFDSVAGLTWKDSTGVRLNDDAPAVPSLDEYGLDLGMMVSSVVRHLDFWTSAPFHTWWRHPITAVFTVRGCARGCVTCGASRSAFRRFMPADFPLLRSPAGIAGQVHQLAEIAPRSSSWAICGTADRATFARCWPLCRAHPFRIASSSSSSIRPMRRSSPRSTRRCEAGEPSSPPRATTKQFAPAWARRISRTHGWRRRSKRSSLPAVNSSTCSS